ncbi:Glycosyltransferase [Theobroma cacao]|nr:Glycosyltransferase [Theobroma cacao]
MSPQKKFSVRSMLGPFRRMSKKSLTYRLISRMAKSPVLSTISLAAILFFIYADSLMSNLSVHNANIKTGEVFPSTQTQTTPVVEGEGQVATSLNSLPVAAATTIQERKIEETENEDPLIPPFKASVDERMEWFRRKLPELEILKSNELSERFHGRVLELFNNKCSAQFFMVWLSTAQSFGPREFLAVDSLFSTAPDGCLLILSSSMDSPKGYRILKPLIDRGFNVLAVTPDLPFLVKNTPAEPWLDDLKSGNMDPGSIPLFNHLSDLIRLAVLYKYGGVYLDTDFIFLKDLSGLRNAIGAQSINQQTKKWTRLNGAVMIFDIHHPVLVEFLREYATTFNGNRWGHNGPYLVSRVLERLRENSEYNITVFPPKAFYPVDWIKIAKLFKKPETEADLKWADDTLADISNDSFVVHLWNKRSRELKIEEGSVMARMIAEHCNICENIYDP